MEKIIKDCEEIRQKCSEYSLMFPSTSNKPSIPDSCFSMIFNQSTLTLEVLAKYYSIWKNVPSTLTKGEIEQQRADNRSRCIEITKQFFVGAISSIEYSVRELIISVSGHPLTELVQRREKLITNFDFNYKELDSLAKAKLKSFRKALKDVPPFDSFGRIVERSSTLGYLQNEEAELLKFCLKLRNCAVHNNSIADQDVDIIIKRRVFEMRAKTMIKGKLDVFTFLIDNLLEVLKSWFEKLLINSV